MAYFFYYDTFNRLEAKYREGTGITDCPTTSSGSLLAEYTYCNSGPGIGQVQTISGNVGSPGAYEDTFTYDYRGHITDHSREINSRSYAMSVNDFDELDRPVTTAYDYPGSG
jgi:hypothetical protein